MCQQLIFFSELVTEKAKTMDNTPLISIRHCLGSAQAKFMALFIIKQELGSLKREYCSIDGRNKETRRTLVFTYLSSFVSCKSPLYTQASVKLHSFGYIHPGTATLENSTHTKTFPNGTKEIVQMRPGGVQSKMV